MRLLQSARGNEHPTPKLQFERAQKQETTMMNGTAKPRHASLTLSPRGPRVHTDAG